MESTNNSDAEISSDDNINIEVENENSIFFIILFINLLDLSFIPITIQEVRIGMIIAIEIEDTTIDNVVINPYSLAKILTIDLDMKQVEVVWLVYHPTDQTYTLPPTTSTLYVISTVEEDCFWIEINLDNNNKMTLNSKNRLDITRKNWFEEQ